MKNFKTTVAVFSALFLLNACDRVPADSNAVAGEAKSVVTIAGAEAPMGTADLSPSTFQPSRQVVRQLAERERELVQAFDARYGDALIRFRSPEQRDWLVARSYPLPEDVLQAATMTDEQLLSAFQQGDRQAGFFYLDRVSEQRAEPGLAPEKQREWDALADEFLASGTPLAGFAYFNYKRTGLGDLPAAMAGLTFAGDLGDGRADLAMMDLAAKVYQDDPAKLDPMMLLMSYRSIQTLVRGRNPAILSRRWPQFPPDEA